MARFVSEEKATGPPGIPLTSASRKGIKSIYKGKEGCFVTSVFRNLAIIILSAKFCGLVARKCKAPQVVGEILAGLLIGPCVRRSAWCC